MQLPDLTAIIQPLIDTLKAAIPLIAAIILIWVVIDEWTSNPGRFSWFAVLWKAIAVGIIGYLIYNADTILQGIITS